MTHCPLALKYKFTMNLKSTLLLLLCLMMAGMVLSIIPILILYFALQKHIIEGVVAGAVKG